MKEILSLRSEISWISDLWNKSSYYQAPCPGHDQLLPTICVWRPEESWKFLNYVEGLTRAKWPSVFHFHWKTWPNLKSIELDLDAVNLVPFIAWVPNNLSDREFRLIYSWVLELVLFESLVGKPCYWATSNICNFSLL